MNIKEAAKVLTSMSYTDEEREAFDHLAKIANEPESKTGSLKQVMADIEAMNGKLTREEAMIAYCSGEEVEVSNGRITVVASVVGQAPKIDGKHGGIPLFCNEDLSFRIAPKLPKLVDGLEACKAYRGGKKVVRNYLAYQKGVPCHPDFTLDGWEIID